MAKDQERRINSAIIAAAEKFPRHDYVEKYTYGTAGFRMEEGKLDFVVLTVGMIAAQRSRKLNGQTIGVMITASHNPASDNGVKVVDPQGDMLTSEWEPLASDWANAMSSASTSNMNDYIMGELHVNVERPAHVIFARDTRPSGERLVKALKGGLDALEAEYQDFGVLTTPQLHYLVKAINTKNSSKPYGEVSEEGYYKKLATAFKTAMDGAKPIGSLTVDCANGVGAPKLKELLKFLPSKGEDGHLDIHIVNDKIDNPDVLNKNCGADYVKTGQRVPANFSGKPFDRWCSFDGDADRIIYYYNEEGSVFRLLDGDRIAILAADFIGNLVQKAGLSEKITLRVVQTAYANGASTKYIEQVLKLKVDCTPTGVKHLHHAAQRADIGVYFEANGHGTVLFSPSSMKRIFNHEPESPAQLEALNTLRALTDLINQTVGDALSDMLLVECVLAHKEYTVKEWLATYTDLPNRLGKKQVANRAAYVTEAGSAERRLAKPKRVQEQINEIVPKYQEGRCFVRASGTENAVRIYCEAAESYDVDDMFNKVMNVIN